MFKVEIRKYCKICGETITSKRFRTFCSKKCRTKNTNIRYRDYRNKWFQDKRGKYSILKKQCALCGKWYVQVGSHVVQRHGITTREYREECNLPLKRSITPSWYHKLKGEQALENKTAENIKLGKRFWFKKGDKRAIIKKGKLGFKSCPNLPISNFY